MHCKEFHLYARVLATHNEFVLTVVVRIHERQAAHNIACGSSCFVLLNDINVGR